MMQRLRTLWVLLVYKKRSGAHAALEGWSRSTLLYVLRNRRFIRDREPRTSTSTFIQLLNSLARHRKSADLRCSGIWTQRFLHRARSVGDQETARASVSSREVTLHFPNPWGRTPAGHGEVVGDTIRTSWGVPHSTGRPPQDNSREVNVFAHNGNSHSPPCDSRTAVMYCYPFLVFTREPVWPSGKAVGW